MATIVDCGKFCPSACAEGLNIKHPIFNCKIWRLFYSEISNSHHKTFRFETAKSGDFSITKF